MKMTSRWGAFFISFSVMLVILTAITSPAPDPYGGGSLAGWTIKNVVISLAAAAGFSSAFGKKKGKKK